MVYGPTTNINPQGSTKKIPRRVADTAASINVNNAGSGYTAIASAFSKFARIKDKEEEKKALDALIREEDKALEAYRLEVFKDPALAHKASRTGNYSAFNGVNQLLENPAVVAGLESINASAMSPNLLKELNARLDALKPGDSPHAVRRAFIEESIEGLPDGVSNRIIESLTTGSNAKVASVKQAQENDFNSVQLNSFKVALQSELGSGTSTSMASIEKKADAVVNALQGEYIANAEKVRQIVAEGIVRAQQLGGPEGVRAAKLATVKSQLFGGGSINSIYDVDTQNGWRKKAQENYDKVITEKQNKLFWTFSTDLLKDPSNAKAHWIIFHNAWVKEGGSLTHPRYNTAFKQYSTAKGSEDNIAAFWAGRIRTLPQNDARKALTREFDRLNQTGYAPTVVDMNRIVKVARILDGGLSKDNQKDLSNLMMHPDSGRGFIEALRAAQTSFKRGEGDTPTTWKEPQLTPAELLGENSRALLVYSLVNDKDLTGDNFKVEMDRAVELVRNAGKNPRAFSDWIKNNSEYNSRRDTDKDELAWYVNEHWETISRDTGISEDILKDHTKWSASLRAYLLGNLNMAVNLNPEIPLEGEQLAEKQGMFAGRRKFVEVDGKFYPLKTLGVGTDQNGDLVQVKYPPLTSDVARLILGDGSSAIPYERQDGVSVVTSEIDTNPIEFPDNQVVTLPGGWADSLGGTLKGFPIFSRVDVDDDVSKLTPGQFTEIDGNVYFYPLRGKEGRRIYLDSSESDYLEFRDGLWRRLIDNARAPSHTSNVGWFGRVVEFYRGRPDAVIPKSQRDTIWDALGRKGSAVTLDDDTLIAKVGQFGKRRDSGRLMDRFRKGDLTKEDLALLPPDYRYEYKRRILDGAEGPFKSSEELTDKILRIILDATGTPSVPIPSDAPTTVKSQRGTMTWDLTAFPQRMRDALAANSDEDTPSNQEIAAQTEVAKEVIQQGISQGDVHPSAADHEVTTPEDAIKAIENSNAENNFIPAGNTVAMNTAQTIIDSYPVINWTAPKVGNLGDHELSKKNNPMGITDPQTGAALSFTDHNEGILNAATAYINKFDGGSTSIRQLLGEGFTGRGQAVVDSAKSMLGKSEHRDAKALIKYFSTASDAGGKNVNPENTPWCAAFTNAALTSQGFKGSGSLIATSFLNWGREITVDDIKPGDVLVEARGKAAYQTGGHVGIATGRVQQLGGNEAYGDIPNKVIEVEMVGGNQGDSVQTQWVDISKLNIRRADPGNKLPNAPLQSEPTRNLGKVKTVARHVGVDLDQSIDLKNPEVLIKFLQGLAEAEMGNSSKEWAPHIKAAINNKPMSLPNEGTGDMVTGAGFRLDWPTSENILREAGVTDIGKVSSLQAEYLVHLRVDELMKALPTWFDGVNLSGAQRGALVQFLYTSPWSEETNRPLILTDKLISAIQSGNTKDAAKIIRRETRVFRLGLNAKQKADERNALKYDRNAIATRFERN